MKTSSCRCLDICELQSITEWPNQMGEKAQPQGFQAEGQAQIRGVLSAAVLHGGGLWDTGIWGESRSSQDAGRWPGTVN
jgi:hypothetical protein